MAERVHLLGLNVIKNTHGSKVTTKTTNAKFQGKSSWEYIFSSLKTLKKVYLA